MMSIKNQYIDAIERLEESIDSEERDLAELKEKIIPLLNMELSINTHNERHLDDFGLVSDVETIEDFEKLSIDNAEELYDLEAEAIELLDDLNYYSEKKLNLLTLLEELEYMLENI